MKQLQQEGWLYDPHDGGAWTYHKNPPKPDLGLFLIIIAICAFTVWGMLGRGGKK